MSNRNEGPSIFFYANNNVLFYRCSLAKGEMYGDFINYPHSHDDIWRKNHQQKFLVEFDYYPRGRVVYRQTDDTYLIYYDKCMESVISLIAKQYPNKKWNSIMMNITNAICATKIMLF